jgi:hypothetical protein
MIEKEIIGLFPRFTLSELEAAYPAIAQWAKGPTVLGQGTVDRIDCIEVSHDGAHAWVYFKDDPATVAYNDGYVMLSKQEYDELKKIKEAAKMAFEHLSYLDGCGALARDDEPMMQALREALKPAKQRAIAEIAHIAEDAGMYD